MAKYISIYESGEEHVPGFHFAINVDIANFEVFAAQGTGRALNERAVPSGYSPQIVWMRSTGDYALAYIDPKMHEVVLRVFHVNVGDAISTQVLSEFSLSASSWLLETSQDVIAAIESVSNDELIVVMRSGRYAKVVIGEDNKVTDTGSLPSSVGSVVLDVKGTLSLLRVLSINAAGDERVLCSWLLKQYP